MLVFVFVGTNRQLGKALKLLCEKAGNITIGELKLKDRTC